ncbi:hypothetical protein D3C75_893330 [compost metagenome]
MTNGSCDVILFRCFKLFSNIFIGYSLLLTFHYRINTNHVILEISFINFLCFQHTLEGFITHGFLHSLELLFGFFLTGSLHAVIRFSFKIFVCDFLFNQIITKIIHLHELLHLWLKCQYDTLLTVKLVFSNFSTIIGCDYFAGVLACRFAAIVLTAPCHHRERQHGHKSD